MIEFGKSGPLVSICIPMYNVAEYIEETIQKILKQTYKDIEIVIVDDFSSDNSYEIAEKYESKKVKLFRNTRKGGNSARNYAFKKSSGTYIKFLDADDYCSENMIEKQLERMLKEGTNQTLIHSPLQMVYSDGTCFLPPRTIDIDFKPGIELLVAIWKRKGFNVPHCHLMHRNLVMKAGMWNEKLLKNQDGEFFARVASLADKSLSVNNVYAFWRQTNKGVSAKVSLKAHSAVIQSYDIISDLLIKYDNSLNMRNICGEYIGFFVFENYLQIKKLIPDIEKLLFKIDSKLQLPNRKIIKIFTFFFGWKMGLKFMNRLKMIK